MCVYVYNIYILPQHIFNTVQNKFAPCKALECLVKHWSGSPSDLSDLWPGPAPDLCNMESEYYQQIFTALGSEGGGLGMVFRDGCSWDSDKGSSEPKARQGV